MTSQNFWSAHRRAFLLSAEVPGVNVLLSPAELNDAAPCCALEMAEVLVPQSAVSHWANAPVPPLGTLPNADAFSSAASSCWSACIRFWSSEVRLVPVDLVETELQNPPMSWLDAVVKGDVTVLPQMLRSMIPAVAATPGNVCPYLEPPSHAICASCGCVAQ